MTVPFYCVAFAFLHIYFPRLFVIVGQAKRPEGFDNRHPRAQQAQLTGWAARANGAHLNSFEAFAPFAAAVVVAHLAHANPAHAAALALTHVAARVAYVWLYLGNLASLRSLVWSVGFLSTLALFASPLVS